ncbi:MAG: universal stress protein [Verrucomicrobiota bacterium]
MKSILLCADGSGYSGLACQYAAWVATRTGAQVSVLYVSNLRQYEAPFLMDLGASLGASPYTAVMGQMDKIEQSKAQLIQEYTTKMLNEAGLSEPPTFHHETGLLVDTICDFEAGPRGVDLVILGKRGEHAENAPDHLGHNMERVVRASKKPCLVTNRAYGEIKKVVFAYDGGESCRKALDWIGRTKLLDRLELHVISVGEGRGGGKASDRLAEAESALKEAGRQPLVQVLTGDVEDAIEYYVNEVAADLLLMGAYGHSRIRELIIGSTTRDLLQRCKIPLLLFR